MEEKSYSIRVSLKLENGKLISVQNNSGEIEIIRCSNLKLESKRGLLYVQGIDSFHQLEQHGKK